MTMRNRTILILSCVGMLFSGLAAGERMIYVSRHCQAAGKAQSAAKPIRGDAGITELGIRQSKMLGGALKKLKFSGPIFASPYYRTVATASYAARECGATVRPDARFQERASREGGNIRTGGAKLEELKALFPDVIASDAKLDPEWLIKKKEKHPDQSRRLEKALDELLAENPDRDFMIVTHAGAVGALARILCKRCGIEFDKDNCFIWNCCLFKFAVDDAGKYRFAGYDISFMPEEAVTSNLKDSLANHKAGGKKSKSGVDYKL